jgi:hypothetical protein
MLSYTYIIKMGLTHPKSKTIKNKETNEKEKKVKSKLIHL